MILLVHTGEEVYEIIDLKTNQIVFNTIKKPAKVLFIIANKYKERLLVWCHISQKDNINFEALKASFHLKNMMLSYSGEPYLPLQIGYVEDSPFLKVNKTVKYPTWLMSSNVGAIHASQLLRFESKIKLNQPFDFVLNSIAKLGMPNGLLCYSEPNLLIIKNAEKSLVKAKNYQLFKFVKQHYKSVWCVLLLLNFMVYEKRFPIISFIRTLFFKNLKFSSDFDLEPLCEQEIKDVSIDVIIPTLGRKAFLHDVLLDLEKQTFLPKQVIIVEQNEDKNSKSDLDFIANNVWPFKIIHKFIHQTGACNARNMALKEVTSDYVYLADDDNKFDSNLLEKVIHKVQYFNFSAITMSYLQKNEVEKYNKPIQWNAFGGGCSVICSKFLNKISFHMAYEFGYGEDTDFGMQLRNLGADIIYMPDIKILHLKAPIGGFRTKFKHPWELEKGLQPKPSPTVMLSRMSNTTKHQLLSYKTNLFIKFYKSQKIKNPFKYYSTFKKQWQVSLLWANKLKENPL
ncbi:glycosyltransferase family A protein [Litoribaculum gwangyangense]|uniref:Glycosyltransferase family A protein n=1 Tax=Litoribaculum gwangyangense TaxID=1130722 RepID=A0ABP9CVG8_9FLAO